ncbi:Ctr copper transporter family-domain-containing protein [Aspergillus californicus]
MDMDMGTTVSSTPTLTSSAGGAATSSSMSMSMGGSCKISMLWNWNTIDTCFIASSWHNDTRAKFAGSCVGVLFLVVALEFLRRVSKEYDRHLVRQHAAQASGSGLVDRLGGTAGNNRSRFTPNIFEQSIRALIHMVTFAVAYFVMLLAMYYNGYIIICIFIGAFLGAFIFSWEPIGGASSSQTSAANETTVCCG